MSENNQQYEYPEIEPHDKKTCPVCEQPHTQMEHYPDLLPFDDGYVEGKDQSETYYACDECETEWRYTGDDANEA